MWPNPQFPAVLITFTEEILNGKLHFLWVLVIDGNPVITKFAGEKTLDLNNIKSEEWKANHVHGSQ